MSVRRCEMFSVAPGFPDADRLALGDAPMRSNQSISPGRIGTRGTINHRGASIRLAPPAVPAYGPSRELQTLLWTVRVAPSPDPGSRAWQP